MPKIFHDFDLKNFWQVSEYAAEKYVEKKPTPLLIAEIEAELGFKLPASYIELLQSQNGGRPRNRCFPTKVPTSWANDHIQITGIMGIGREKMYSLCGELGSPFMQDEWGYPAWGVCICNCPSSGHDMVMLDYRQCGKSGEPSVVHVNQESDYEVTPLAANFELFIRGLVNESVYDTSAEDLTNDLAIVAQGSFSNVLQQLVTKAPNIDFNKIIRNLCRTLTQEKGHFSLHADERSQLMYDIQFFLSSLAKPIKSSKEYLASYEKIIALVDDGEFTTGGYAPDFVKEWLQQRIAEGSIVKQAGSYEFSDSFGAKFLQQISDYAS